MSAKLFEGSNVSANYAKYRISSPQQLITEIIDYLLNGVQIKQKWTIAVDIGCGSGQTTKLLSPYFERVYGFDISETQIKEAVKNNKCPNVEYKVATAESLPIDDNSVYLVTVSQAIYYFDLPAFYKEIERCLKLNGVLAVIGYKLPEVYPCDDLNNEKFKSLICEAYRDELLDDYTDKRSNMIFEEGYNCLLLPFNDFVRIDGKFSAMLTLTVTEILGHIESWTGYNLLSKSNPDDAKKVLEKVKTKMMVLAGDKYSDSLKFNFLYKFILLLSRKSSSNPSIS